MRVFATVQSADSIISGHTSVFYVQRDVTYIVTSILTIHNHILSNQKRHQHQQMNVSAYYIVYIVYYVLYIIQYIVYYILYIIYYILYIIYCILYVIYCILYIIYYILFIIYYILYIVSCILYIMYYRHVSATHVTIFRDVHYKDASTYIHQFFNQSTDDIKGL